MPFEQREYRTTAKEDPNKREDPKWGRFKNALKLAGMNWTYVPYSNGNPETISDRLLRYSHMPSISQLFSYLAYKGACQRLFGRYWIASMGVHYFFQDFNYVHTPGYRAKDSKSQLLMQAGESAVLGGFATLIIRQIHKFPRRSFGWHFIAFSSFAVPAVIGEVWARRHSLRDGSMLYGNDGLVVHDNKQAAYLATAQTAGTRALIGLTNVTLPLILIRLFEKNYVFFTPLKGMVFGEITAACGLTLNTLALAAFYPIGRVKRSSVGVSDAKPTTTTTQSPTHSDNDSLTHSLTDSLTQSTSDNGQTSQDSDVKSAITSALEPEMGPQQSDYVSETAGVIVNEPDLEYLYFYRGL